MTLPRLTEHFQGNADVMDGLIRTFGGKSCTGSWRLTSGTARNIGVLTQVLKPWQLNQRPSTSISQP
jgi:hypothetical protein